MTFTEDVELRDAEDRHVPDTIDVLERMGGDLSERSLFRGVFKAVNPSRTASPTNSRLLASPFRKRLKSQVIGRVSCRPAVYQRTPPDSSRPGERIRG